MSFHDDSPGSLYDLLTADLLNGRATEPGVVGAISLPAITSEAAAALVRSVLDFAAKTYGDQAEEWILSHKAEIRAIVGPALLELTDSITHGLMDLKIAKP